MGGFTISELTVRDGQLALCPMPGRCGDYPADLAAIIGWRPSLVLTMATGPELARYHALGLPGDLGRHAIEWRHLPVADYAADSTELRDGWAAASQAAHGHLAVGRRVLAHCMGGCGRSGMAVLRLMVEAGEAPDVALARLRIVRPCAVETEAQRIWAANAVD